LKKFHVTLLVLLTLAAITVGCGDSTPGSKIPVFTKVPFISDRATDPATPLFVANLDLTSATGIVTNNGSWTYSPSISADLKIVAYASDSEIWVTDTTGTTPIQLTDNVANGFYSFFVKVSPDGTKLLYSFYDGANYHLLIMHPDGTGSVDLTPTPPTGMTDCYTGSFSADSSTIAFTCTGSTGGGVYAMNVDGTGTTPIYTENSFLDGAMFTPDGSKIIFVDFGGAASAAARRNLKTFPHLAVRPHAVKGAASTPGTLPTTGIFSVNLDGSNLASLVPTAFEAVILNSTLYYTYYDSNLSLDQIYSSALDGTGAVSISDGTSDDYLGVSAD
jgi:Tol biopolymer transport system component